MDSFLEDIKAVLESEAYILIDTDEATLTISDDMKRSVVDYRIDFINKIVDSINDNESYAKVIEMISIYLDVLFNREIELSNVQAIDSNGEIIGTCLGSSDVPKLCDANEEFAKQLFEKVVSILESHKDIVLDIETLKRLFNRNPKELTFLAKPDYVSRPFAFKKLAKVLKENETIKKSNISIEDGYQRLYDPCQTNQEVFANIISADDFKENHKKIDELLLRCNAKTFVEIINIVRNNFDENYDVLNILRQIKRDNFCEAVIVEILTRYYTDEDVELIHSILTEASIQINYNYACLSCYGQSINLITTIAASDNRILISDLLSKENNVKCAYFDEVSVVYLYNLYAIAGQYDKALNEFLENYSYKNDFKGDLSEEKCAYGDWGYKDSLVEFIRNILDSCRTDNIEYKEVKNILERILTAKNVEYINLAVILPILKAILEESDYQTLFALLMERYSSGDLRFTIAKEVDEEYVQFEIRVATEEDVQKGISDLNKKPNKGLELN